ncbi:MAG: hypothetical protein QGF97_04055 [Alphaproteobacteria bacterium]|jgi:surface carbohydrate biosynthesis protein|nr:hypothetical protein [Alphaproteobacteria bacterium]
MSAQPPWLLLPIETKVREFHAKLLLAAVAAEQGYQVLLGEQNAMLAQRRHLPRGIYIDKSVGRTKTANFRRLKAAGSRVAAWCEEGPVYRDRDTYLHERVSNESLAEASLFFAWGEVQAGDVRLKAPEAAAKIRLSGNPRFDLLRPEWRGLFAPQAEALRRRFGPYLLLNGNFSRYNHFMGYDFWIEALKQRGTITNQSQLAFFRHWRDFLGEIFHGFTAALPVLARAFPEHRLIVRPHPSEDHDEWRRQARGLDNVEVVYEGSVIPWLLAAEAVLHNSCTTGLEAYLLGRPVVAFRPACDAILDSELPNAVSRQAFELDELVAVIGEVLEGGTTGAPDAGLAARYIAALDGPLAAEQVVAALDEIAFPGASLALGPVARLGLAGGQTLAAVKPWVRRLRQGARANAYAAQKFPGIELEEVAAGLQQFRELSGRFNEVRSEALPLRHCFLIGA